MTNLEYLKKNFNKFKLYDEDLFCELAFICKTGERCEGFKYERCSEGCGGCQFRNIRNAIDYLLQEHKEPIKLKQWEKDLLKSFGDTASHYKFDYFPSLRGMKSMAYFEGVKDTSMELGYILGNCEVVE